jgi:hypothetical protein
VNEGCDLYREVTMNEAQLVKAIKTLVEKGDKARDRAEQFYVAAGQHLKTLKEHCVPAWESSSRQNVVSASLAPTSFSRSVMVAPRSRSSELQRRSG